MRPQCRLLGDARQVDREGGALAELAVHGNVAARGVQDARDDAQAQAGAVALVLGGEERLEKMGFGVFVHAAAGVGDLQEDVSAGEERRRGGGQVDVRRA